MRGHITSYDSTTQTGVIKGEDGAAYIFARHDIQTGAEIVEGHSVEFVPNGSTATNIIILTGTIDDQSKSDPAAAFAAAASSAFTATPPSQAYDFKSALLSFQGRLRRQHFWISFLILLGANIVVGWIPLIGWLIGLALIWPSLAISVKRLHDMGKSGWFAAIPYAGGLLAILVAMIGGGSAFIMAAASGDEAAATAAALSGMGAIALASLIWLVTNLGFLLWIGLVDSQPGDNQYGPNPKTL